MRSGQWCIGHFGKGIQFRPIDMKLFRSGAGQHMVDAWQAPLYRPERALLCASYSLSSGTWMGGMLLKLRACVPERKSASLRPFLEGGSGCQPPAARPSGGVGGALTTRCNGPIWESLCQFPKRVQIVSKKLWKRAGGCPRVWCCEVAGPGARAPGGCACHDKTSCLSLAPKR